jgi:hypothetical protein
VDGSKIILGIPYYGLDWPTVSQNIGSATTGTASAKIYYYAFQNANTYGRMWDDYSLTPWYRYYTTEWHQCWYDDSVSLDIKFGMVNDSLLEGAGCWALGYDRSYDHIWNAIRNNFWDPQAIAEEVSEQGTRISQVTIFSDVLVLSNLMPEQEYRIIIYDISGRKLFDEVNKGITQFEIGEGLTPGVYFMNITGSNRIIKKKLLKVR